MGSKAEFGQRLLDDLRMRKQWMGKSHNSSNAEKYRDFKHPCRESREIGTKGQDAQKLFGNSSRPNTGRSSSSSRSLNRVESSQELVPVGRARSSEQVSDWSMALAFALRKGGEFQKNNSGNTMGGYLNYHGSRSVDFREIDKLFHLDRGRPSYGRTPTLSPLHVKEIAKGAQKLNQILKTCYNGLNFDIYSTDIGQELLKGARDLEESLKMLVDLQEASEYMVVPQKQQKVRLCEVDDDGEEIDKVNKGRHSDRPRFSFDKNSRNSVEYVGGVTKNSAKQKLLAITYHRETPQLSSGKKTPSTSKLVSHRRSASCGPDPSTTTSLSITTKHSSPSVSQPGKGRIPNIIAKLMGLEELPAKESNVEAEKEIHVKQGARTDSKKALQGNSKKEEKLNMKSEKTAQQTTVGKMRHAETQSTAPETSLVVYVDKINSTRSPFEMEAGERKLQSKGRKHKDNIELKSDLKKSKVGISTAQQHSNSANLVNNAETKPKQEKQMNKGRGEASKALLKDDVHKVSPPTQKPSNEATPMQERTETKKDTAHKEKRDANTRMVRNLEKPPHQFQPPNVLKKSKYQDVKLRENERDQRAKTLSYMKKTKASEMSLKHSSIATYDSRSSQKKLPLINHINPSIKASTEAYDAKPSKISAECSQLGDFSKRKNVTAIKSNIREAPNENPAKQKPFTRDPKTEFQNIVDTLKPAVIRKSMKVLVAEKVDDADMQNGINSNAIKEVTIMAMPLKKETSVAVESKQSTVRSSTEADVNINRSIEAKPSVQRLNSPQKLLQDGGGATISSMGIGEHQRLTELEPNAPNATVQDNNTQASHSMELATISPTNDQELPSSNIVSNSIKDFQEDEAVHISKSFQRDPPKILKYETPEQLTDNEKHLKQILVNSQLFLNAAEALFGLQIPIGILNSSVDKHQDDLNKLALDCGFEVMKRKGRRKEFTSHPLASVSISTWKIRSLDDLVKDLHNDLETLKCHTKHETDCDIANSLHEMLHKDIQKSKPDVNCMWDLGWDDGMFAYLEKEGVVKDVEKHVLNGLLDEFVNDIVHFSTVI